MTIDSEVTLICHVIFRNGRPVLIKALSNYPDPNPLLKAFDIDEAIAQEANKTQQELLTELLGELPEKRHIPLRQAEDGEVVHDFNTAIDQVVSVIKSKIGELNG